MRKRILAAATAGAALALTVIVAWPAGAKTVADLSPAALALGRQTLPVNDGWAASGTGTTGGAAADDAHVFVASNRAELIAALGGDNATNGKNAIPKIVYINGGIDANVDDNDNPLTCADYADPEYSLDAFLAAYDPAVWGRASKPSGPVEDARVRSTKNQGARININIGPNTTIIGLRGSKIVGANLQIKSDNVILRNVTAEDAHDCFPGWDPTDGSAGNWNSLYDIVSVTGGTHVWVDHVTLTDANNHDADQPVYFGRPWQVHDGALDITKAADLVTVSYSVFYDHDKTMLIGSTNTVGADVGKLRVTVHHNKFANAGQRLPRVRFGQVDVYDNYYYLTDEDSFSYAWGVGVYSAIYAENNFFLRSADIPLDAFVYNWGGVGMTELGTMVRVGTGKPAAVSLLAEYNATHDPDLGTDAGWVPTLRAGPVDPTANVPALVTAKAGSNKLAT